MENPITLPAALAAAARARPLQPFILHGDEVTTYAELESASERAAEGLLTLGLGAGDRVGLLSLNRVEWLVLFFACARIGAVAVAMSPRYREAELGHILRDSEVKAVATIGEHEGYDFLALFDRLSAAVPVLQHLILMPGTEMSPEPRRLHHLSYAQLLSPRRGGAASSAVAAVTGESPAMVIYTSGTTGRPKGACLTHASMLASARAQAAHMRIGDTDLLTLASPLNHVGGITCGVLTLLAGGGRIDLVAEFKAPPVLDRIRLHRPTLLAGVPTMMTLLLMKSEGLDIDFSCVRLAFIGGSNVDPALLAQLQRRLPAARLMNLYGLSETSGAIVITPWEASDDDLMRTIGEPLAEAQVRVIEPGSSEDVPRGEVGELCFRGCGVVPGYVGAARTANLFAPGGWLRTGDLGKIDERGVITLWGRAKDMFIQGGFNIYPAEVEAHIAQHPEVLLVAGIGAPDPVLGEIGHYFVVRKPGGTVSEAALLAWCTQGLADYKVPRRLEFRSELPLTPAGKIHKAALRAERST